MSENYFIAKDKKTVGPCTLDDLRSYLAYGSIGLSDLVMREGEKSWSPLSSLDGLASEDPKGNIRDITQRRRVARYRDYEKVPEDHRSGVVLKGMIVGFTLFPPSLWKAAVTIFQNRIFRPAKDAHGYLQVWPRWVEVVVSVMIVVNLLAWSVAVIWVTNESSSFIHAVGDAFQTACGDLARWLNGVLPD